MKLRIFVLVYGEAFLALLERAAVASLLQPANRSALPSGAVVSLHTDATSKQRAIGIMSKLGLPIEVSTVTTTEHPTESQHRAVIDEMKACLAQDAAMLMITPDMFFGDGSIGNLLAIAGDQKLCVAAPHVRVNRDEFLDELPLAMKRGSMSNAHLVAMAMHHLHRTWKQADPYEPVNNCYWSGVAIRQLGPKLWSVQHRLPNIFLAWFRPEDLAFWDGHEKRGLWDHHWPSPVMEAQRHRTICSSDGFFAAELTPRDENRPRTEPASLHDRDRYIGQRYHHVVSRNPVSIWRAA